MVSERPVPEKAPPARAGFPSEPPDARTDLAVSANLRHWFEDQMRPRFLACFSLITAAAGPQPATARDAPDYHTGPPPAWVESRTLPPARDNPERSIRPGIIYRLIDIQTNVEAAEKYFHFADEFITSAGVRQHSTLEIEFDPDHETLTLHRILIHRRGDSRDLLQPANIRIASFEDEIDLGILDGHRTAVVVLPDVRPGDVVEYDYTISGRNPSFQGLYFDHFPMRWESPVREVHYRILKQKDRPLHCRNHLIEMEPRRRDLGNSLEEWSWERKNVPALKRESGVPGWHTPLVFVSVSELETWADVAEWGSHLYRFSDEPLDPGLQERIERIRQDHSDAVGQTMAAIRFVQDDIRYLGIEDGANAFRPTNPNETFRRRFGDCKDKTSLLRRILAELGIESDPVYVHQTRTRAIDRQPPSPLAFDHVVLRIRPPGAGPIWCDPTRALQGGGPETFYFPRFGKGLILEAGGSGRLTDLPAPSPEHHRIEMVMDFHPGKPNQPARLEVTTTETGAEADSARSYLQTHHRTEVERRYLDYHRHHFDDIHPEGEIEVEDDRDRNRIVTRERYRIENFWTPDDSDPGWFFVQPALAVIRDALEEPDTVTRTMPFAIDRPGPVRAVIRFHVPEPLEDWTDYFEAEDHFIEAPGLEFRRTVRYASDKGILTIDGELRTTADAVAPEEIREYRDRTDDIYDLTSYLIWDLVANPETETREASEPESEEGSAGRPISGARHLPVAAISALAGAGLGALIAIWVIGIRRRKRRVSP